LSIDSTTISCLINPISSCIGYPSP
jgi:hypothetical protein